LSFYWHGNEYEVLEIEKPGGGGVAVGGVGLRL